MGSGAKSPRRAADQLGADQQRAPDCSNAPTQMDSHRRHLLRAAAVADGFVARTVALDASPLSNSASRSAASSSTVAAKSTTFAATFPEANREGKGNRLRVPIPDNQVGAAIEQDTKDRDSRSVQSGAPREGERKPVVHCEPVGSPLAGPAILHMPPRRCFARLGTLPQYTLVDSVAPRAS